MEKDLLPGRAPALARIVLALALLLPGLARAQAPTFLGQWGAQGSANGQFNLPEGVAVDSKGVVYVADSQNSRVQLFDSSGGYLGQFGTPGRGDGQFGTTMAVAVGPSGSVYVADYQNHRIEKFNSAGVYQIQWGGQGSGPGLFEFPFALATDADENVFVADLQNHRIQEFNSAGGFIRMWGTAGSGDGEFMYPEGVVIDGDGFVYVSDYGNDRIQKFTGEGAFVARWGSNGTAPGQFQGPRGIGVTELGDVCVVDMRNNRIQVFSSVGSLVTLWGSQGIGNSQFNFPNGLAVDGGVALYVADTYNYRIQKFTVPGATSTSLTLGVSPNPSPYGAEVTLTATMVPSTATGPITFKEGATILGTAALVGGTATLSLHDLQAGDHRLSARFNGGNGFFSAISNTVTLTIGTTATTTTLASPASGGSWFVATPLPLQAHVSAVIVGAPAPTGDVRFTLDGVAFGNLVAIDASGTASTTIDALAPGPHAIAAEYLGTVNYNPSASTPIAFTVIPPNPVIVSVRDVPNDQGGRVTIKWRSPSDLPGMRLVGGYRVWRRAPAGVPAGPASAARDSGAVRTTVQYEAFWEAIAELPAEQLGNYAYTAATPQDSIAGSNPYTAFFVTALGADGTSFYQSTPDSGYSVDNLAPPAPAAFAVRYTPGGAALHWLPSRAPDIALYRLYRGGRADFVPGPGNLVTAQADTGYFDATVGEGFYKLAAVDVHGNVGRYALVSPDLPTAALATLVSAEASGTTVRLRWYLSTDEPATVTVYRRAAGREWRSLGTLLPDGSGEARYEDAGLTTGARYGYRLGIQPAGGAEVFAGETWVDLPLAEADLAVRVPNPVADGDVTASFAAPAGRAVPVELFDMAGRVVAARLVEGGSGRQSVDLASGRSLAPGIYLVRVGLERPVVARVAVIR